MSKTESTRVPAWACALERGMTAAESAVETAAPTAGKIAFAGLIAAYNVSPVLLAVRTEASAWLVATLGALVVVADLVFSYALLDVAMPGRYGRDWRARAVRQRGGDPVPDVVPLSDRVLWADRYMTVLERAVVTLAGPLVAISAVVALALFNIVTFASVDPTGTLRALLWFEPVVVSGPWQMAVFVCFTLVVDIVCAYITVDVLFPRLFGARWRERCRSHRERGKA